jgi:uncharacterized protein YgiM (DUF1202 family)
MKRWLLCLLAAATAASAAETASVVRKSELKQAPYTDAATVAEVAAQTQVTVLRREGAWLQVQAGAHSGWLRLLAVRGSASARAGDSGLNQAINVARSGASGTSVATGVRGLSKEQIQNAQPNEEELARMQRHAQDEAQARAFAGQKPALASVTLDYLGAQTGEGE